MKSPKRHSAGLENPHIGSIAKQGEQAACVAIGEDAQRDVKATQECGGKTHPLRSFAQREIDLMGQRGDGIRFIYR